MYKYFLKYKIKHSSPCKRVFVLYTIKKNTDISTHSRCVLSGLFFKSDVTYFSWWLPRPPERHWTLYSWRRPREWHSFLPMFRTQTRRNSHRERLPCLKNSRVATLKKITIMWFKYCSSLSFFFYLKSFFP